MTGFQSSRVTAWRWRYAAAFVLSPQQAWGLVPLLLLLFERVQAAAPAPALPGRVRWFCHFRQQPQAELSLDPLLLWCQLRLPERESYRTLQSVQPFAYGRQTPARSCRPDRTMPVVSFKDLISSPCNLCSSKSRKSGTFSRELYPFHSRQYEYGVPAFP